MKNIRKKGLFLISTTVLVAGIILVNTRADASCNIKKGDKIIYSCEGNVGKCEISKFGYTLECSGKLVAKDGESAGTE